MRTEILRNLSNTISRHVAESLVCSYEKAVAEYRASDLDSSLMAAGRFVENVFRAITFIRIGKAPSEIKSVAKTIKEIEADMSIPESLRVLIPRVAQAMIYDIRSKRGAVHVKDIDPRQVDAALCVQGASWILAEFLRLYHVDREDEVAAAMVSLMRGHLPFVEVFEGETVVTTKVPCSLELLLLLSKVAPAGLDRRALGQSSRYLPSTVTRTLSQLQKQIYIYRTKQGLFHLTGSGEEHLADQLACDGRSSAPISRLQS